MRKCMTHWSVGVAVLGLVATSVPGLLHAQTSCFSYQDAWLDTSGNTDSTPWVDRAIGVSMMTWGGADILVGNVGNELRAWRLSSPTAATAVSSSDWFPNPVPADGDVDQNLFGFSVCDECRYGFAAYRDMGSVVFDLGTGTNPSLGAKTYYPGAAAYGGVVFKIGTVEYLIAPVLDGRSGPRLYELHGTDLANMTELAELRTPSGWVFDIQGGVQYGHYVYLQTRGSSDGILIIDVGTPASPQVVSWAPCAWGPFSISVDRANGYLAVATGGTNPGVQIYDIKADPSDPQFLSGVSSAQALHAVSISYPYLFAASFTAVYQNVWDISVPTSPKLVDDDYWNNFSYLWNGDGGAVPGVFSANAVFHPSNEAMYVARFSQLQVHSVACTAVQPTANLSLAPDPAFPGDEVTVTNTSVGPWTDAAIWITDDQGTVVAGSQTLAGEPSPLQYTIPTALLQSQSYTAHVAVENEDYPYNPQNPGQQLSSVPISIDRTPEATISVTPQAVITGDTVAFSAQAEGHPSTGTDNDPYSWVVTPPAGASCPDNWAPRDPDPGCGAVGQTPPGLVLNTSGTWTADLTVSYQHDAASGAAYQATANSALTVSSVAADFAVSPASPLNTEAVTLDGSSSRWQTGADVSFDWQIAGPSSYSGCGDVQTCVIPADTLSPGTYTVTLTLTNNDNQDESTKQATLDVADGSVQLDFSWAPSSPEIGEYTSFSISGVNGSIDQAVWNFGGPGCTGYSQTTTCTPDYLTDCTVQGFKYASGGQKNVSLTVTVDGRQYTAQNSVTVQYTGTCSEACTYGVSPSSLSFSSSGGTGSISVSAGSSCSWSASSGASWIGITSVPSGTGNGTVRISVASNSTGSSRSGTVTIAGLPVSVTQSSGSTSLDFSWFPSSPQIGDVVTFSLQGLSGSVTQAVWNFGDGGCSGYSQQMTCVPDMFGGDCSEQTFKFSSGGSKTVSVTVTVSGVQQSPVTHTVTVANTGSCESGGCSYSISPTVDTIGADGGSRSVNVSTTSSCDWTASSNVGWASITSGSPGTGSGQVQYSVSSNPGDARQGTMTIAGRTFTINQAGGGGGIESGPLLIPAAASVQGEGGTQWKSDLRIFNPADKQLEISIQFVPQYGDETPYPTLLYNVDPS